MSILEKFFKNKKDFLKNLRHIHLKNLYSVTKCMNIITRKLFWKTENCMIRNQQKKFLQTNQV